MNDRLESDFQLWKATFRADLARHLAALRCDPDLYGFALEPSDDLSNLHFITCVGRESTLRGRSSVFTRFSHVEWNGFLPQRDFDESLQQLETIGQKYHELLIDAATSEDTYIGARFRNRWYLELLKAMIECDRRRDFGKMWFKIITFSDHMHSIQLRSFLRLNCNTSFVSRCLLGAGNRTVSAASKLVRQFVGRSK